MPKSSIAMHAEPFERAESFVNVRGVREQHAFGELENEAGCGQAGIASACFDVADEVVVVELMRRHVDADADDSRVRDRRAPVHRLAARFVEHVAADVDDEAGFLGDRDELVGADEPSGRVLPAHEGFERLDGAECRGRRAAGSGATSSPAWSACRRSPCSSWCAVSSVCMRRLERFEAVATTSLRGVHRDVGSAEQFVGVEGVDGDCRRSRSTHERRLAVVDRRTGLAACRAGAGPSPPRRPAWFRRARSRTRRRRVARRCRRRGRCARSVAATSTRSTSPESWPSVSLIILKPSRSQKSTATGSRRPARSGQRVLESITEQCAVRETGQAVVERLVGELIDELGALGDVAEAPHPTDDGSVDLLRSRMPFEHASVFELERVVAHRVRAARTTPRPSRRTRRAEPAGRARTRSRPRRHGARARRREPPHLGEARAELGDRPIGIDDQHAVGSGVQCRTQQRHRGTHLAIRTLRSVRSSRRAAG